MKLDVMCNKQDEYYSPKYSIKPLLPYLKKFNTIWCPFDTDKSWYVKLLKKDGHDVINTHIDNGQDFFSTYVECDAIVSNPPYSLRNNILKRLFKLDKPFAMLVSWAGIFESQTRFELFKNNNFEIMCFNKRISFFRSYEEEKPTSNPPFSMVYVCHNILPEKIVFEYIDKGDY